MPVYVIGHITVRDAVLWDRYRASVPATLGDWGGELVLRGQRLAVLSGEHEHTDAVVLRFADAAAASGWHTSAAYQALIPLRREAADVVLICYEGVD